MRVTTQISNRDLYEAIGVDKDRAVDRAEVERAGDKLLAYVADHVHVKNGEADCPPDGRALSFADKSDGFFAVTRIDYVCKRSAADARRRVRPLLRPRSDAPGPGAHRAPRPARAPARLPRRGAHAAGSIARSRSSTTCATTSCSAWSTSSPATITSRSSSGSCSSPPGAIGLRRGCATSSASSPPSRSRTRSRSSPPASAGCGCRRASSSRRSRCRSPTSPSRTWRCAIPSIAGCSPSSSASCTASASRRCSPRSACRRRAWCRRWSASTSASSSGSSRSSARWRRSSCGWCRATSSPRACAPGAAWRWW